MGKYRDGYEGDNDDGVTILLVGRVRQLPEIDREVLRRNDVTLLCADPDHEVLNVAQRRSVDLIVIDVAPGQSTGLVLSAEIKSLPVTEDIPVVLVAPATMEEEIARTPTDGVLYRPFREREFLAVVERYTRLRERRHPRFPINLRFTFRAGDRTGQAFSRVLSRSGAFLKTDRPMPRGTRLRLAFTIPGDMLAIECSGVVRNTIEWEEAPDGTPGFGIEFEGVASVDEHRLAAFLENRLRRTRSAS